MSRCIQNNQYNKSEAKVKKNRPREVLTRHKIVTGILRPFFILAVKLGTGARCDAFRDVKNRPYLIVYNHLTPWDQFFCGAAFKAPLYYVAMDDIFKAKYGALLKWLINPIPFRKGAKDTAAVKKCIKIAREGGSICISPEGNRSYDGNLTHIKPSIAKLIKTLKLPVAFFVIDGGYGFNPRWADGKRRGSMRCYVKHVLEPEEYIDLSEDEIYQLIVANLSIPPVKEGDCFRGRNRAEYLERLFFYCPHCGKAEFRSQGAELTCRKCGLTLEYGENLKFTVKTSPKDNADFIFPYETVADWYSAQRGFVEAFDLDAAGEDPIFQEKGSLLDATASNRVKTIIEDGVLRLFNDRLEISKGDEVRTFRLCEIDDAAIVAKKKFSIYCGEITYQFRDDERFNSIKYVNMIYHYKNVKERMQYSYDSREFLGL